MSSGSKSSPRTKTGRAKKTAKKTSARTKGSRRSSGRPAAPVEALVDLARVLSKLRVRWFVFGAQAVNAYGVPRMTADLDVTVMLEPASTGRIQKALELGGFSSRVGDVGAFVARTRVMPLVHRPTGFLVDIVLGQEGLEEEMSRRVEHMQIEGVEVPMISLRDLIVTKVLAGREKDREDVRQLLRTAHGVPAGEIRAALTALDQLLERSDLTPSFERLLRESSET